MKRVKILPVALILLICANIYAEEWEYHSTPVFENSGDGKTQFLELSDSGILYFGNPLGVGLFDINTRLFLDSSVFKSQLNDLIVDYVLDKKERLWIMTHEEIKILEADTVKSPDFINDSIIGKWDYCNFTRTRDKSIRTAKGYHLYNITDSSLKKIDLREYALNLIIGFSGHNYLQYNGEYVFTLNSNKDSLVFISEGDFESARYVKLPDSSVTVRDTIMGQIQEKTLFARVGKMIHYKSGLLFCMKARGISAGSLGGNKYSKLFYLEDNQVNEFEIPYIDEQNSTKRNPSILDFALDNDENLVVSVSYSNNHSDVDNQYASDNRILIIDSTGRCLNDYKIPDIESDMELSEHFGKEIPFSFPDKIAVSKDNRIFCVSNWVHHRGFLELIPDASGIEETEGGASNVVWIMNVYPNPCKSSVFMDFVSLPHHFDDFEVKIYDYLGTEYKNFSFNVINYNPNTAKGKLSVDLANVPSGIKFLQIKSGNETFTEGILIE